MKSERIYFILALVQGPINLSLSSVVSAMPVGLRISLGGVRIATGLSGLAPCGLGTAPRFAPSRPTAAAVPTAAALGGNN